MRKVVKKWIGRTYLSVSGWSEEGEPPAPEQFVLIAAPHTTNWDLPIMMALSFVYDVPIRWVGKHTLFKPPGGWFMKALGGIPVVRHRSESRVQTLARLFETMPNLVLTVPAEGTRSRVEHWKSGFYHIAKTADVPIVCGYLDYGRRRGGFGLVIKPSGDIEADMDAIRAFYADKVGKYPEKFGPVRLRDETTEAEKAA